MMINILSIRCSLAFAPYLAVSTAEFLNDGVVTSSVVRQGGSGLILRSDGKLVLRHEHRQALIGTEEARHYSAIVQFRCEFYDVSRMQDEVVLANLGDELLLSHPQSELWLKRETVAALVRAFTSDSSAKAGGSSSGFPEWLKVSTGGASGSVTGPRVDTRVVKWQDRFIRNQLARLRCTQS